MAGPLPLALLRLDVDVDDPLKRREGHIPRGAILTITGIHRTSRL